MVRNILGSLLALIAAALAVYSSFRPWYDGRAGRTYRLQQLFTTDGFSGSQAPLFMGLFLPLAVAALVTLIAVVLRSRWLTAVAGLIVLATAVLWCVRQAESQGLYIGQGSGGTGIGAATAVGAGLLLLVAAVVLRGRWPRSRAGRHAGARRTREQPGGDADIPPPQPTQARAPHAPAPPPLEEQPAQVPLWYGTPGATRSRPPEDQPAPSAEPQQPVQQQPVARTEEARTQILPDLTGQPRPPEPEEPTAPSGPPPQPPPTGQQDQQTQQIQRAQQESGDGEAAAPDNTDDRDDADDAHAARRDQDAEQTQDLPRFGSGGAHPSGTPDHPGTPDGTSHRDAA